jgi:hypothetical protein
MRRTLCLAALIGGLSAVSSKAADNGSGGSGSMGETCRLLGGTFMVLINGRGHCCWADWGCVECDLDETRCIVECISPKCCEANGSEGDSCIVFEPGSDAIRDEAFGEFADLQVQEGIVVVEDGFVEFADLSLADSVLDPAADLTQGSIIVVGGDVDEVLEDGAQRIPVDPAALDAMHRQVELIIAAMGEDLADQETLDESDDASVDAFDSTRSGSEESTGGDPGGGAVQETGGDAAPTPTPAEQERPLRPHRRGRARR